MHSFSLPQRYHYYVSEGIPLSHLAPMEEGVVERVHCRLHPSLLNNPDWLGVREELWREVEADHFHSLRTAIVDYILMDPGELARLKIASIPRAFPMQTVRAPIPWHDSFGQAKEAQSQQLFATNTVMQQLQKLWHDKLGVLPLSVDRMLISPVHVHFIGIPLFGWWTSQLCRQPQLCPLSLHSLSPL